MNHILMNSGIFGSLSIFFGMLIGAAGLVIILLSKSRSAHRWALLGSFLPVILGFIGTLAGYYLHGRQSLQTLGDEIMTRWLVAELWSPAIVGVVMTGVVFVFLGGLFFLKRPSAS